MACGSARRCVHETAQKEAIPEIEEREAARRETKDGMGRTGAGGVSVLIDACIGDVINGVMFGRIRLLNHRTDSSTIPLTSLFHLSLFSSLLSVMQSFLPVLLKCTVFSLVIEHIHSLIHPASAHLLCPVFHPCCLLCSTSPGCPVDVNMLYNSLAHVAVTTAP